MSNNAPTVATGDPTPTKAPALETGKTEGVDIKGAIKAFREEKARERAEERGETAPVELANEPEAPTESAPESPAKEQDVEVAPAQDLKMRLRAKAARRQADLDARERRLAAWEAENKQRAEQTEQLTTQARTEREKYERLENLRKSNPREFIKEANIPLRELVDAELAELTPAARAAQMGKVLENLPKLIEEKAAALLDAKLKEREAADKSRNEQASRAQFVAKTESDFIDRAKAASEKSPHLADLVSYDPKFAVHTAYYVQSLFKSEHGRDPNQRELDANVEAYLAHSRGEKTASTVARSSNGRTSPRANARESAEKPIEEMNDQERMDAAKRAFRRVKEEERNEDTGRARG